MGRWAGVTLVALVLACARTVAPPAPPGAPVAAAAVPDLELRALLLLLADRKTFEPYSVDQALAGGPALRRELAVTLGRVGDRRALAVLAELSRDRDVEVRRAAVFSFGLLAGPADRAPLLLALSGADRETAAAAAQALARLGTPLEEIEAAAGGLESEERDLRLLPALWRLPGDGARLLAESGLDHPDAAARRWAAYALARPVRPAAAPALRGLLADADPWIRGWAARALGRVGDAGDLDRLRPLLDDPRPGPVIRALGAAAALIRAGKAAPPDGWRGRLAELYDAPHRGVRLTAIESSFCWLLDDQLGARLADLAAGGRPAERRAALGSLARGGDPRAARLAHAAAAAGEAPERAAAAVAAGALGDLALLDELSADPAPVVRQAALGALLELPERAGAAAAAALADPDPGVRAAALGWLESNPELPTVALLAAVDWQRWDRAVPELPLAAVRALVARAEAAPGEETEITAFTLERLAVADSYLLRRAAADGLERLGRSRPPVGSVETGRRAVDYQLILQQTWQPRLVELVTPHGALRVRLPCRPTPLACLGFLQLVRQGFYDGLEFHRVVPDFVVQGGDPRGDGWGGPGFTLRDELDRRRFVAGSLGLALGGPDTGGSQFFVTLSEQPHLDDSFTVLGRLVDGWQVLDRIAPGDPIVTAREVEGAAPAGLD